MSKSSIPFLAAGAGLFAALALAGIPGSAEASASCAAGRPSVLVRVDGLKQPTGQLKVSLYGSDASLWLAKQGRIHRTKVPVTGKAMDICLPVPAPGRYAVAVHHDLNLNGSRDRQDGGGYSRNPKVSLLNPKPPFARASFPVGQEQAQVGVTLLYIKGMSVGPAGS
ncbi:DUF2141 domain-containing protein [Sphingomonas xanthus]|uniref:DUF2141 domain-containing protein n=1 Tax=Sphingomonas xanthus TaxID=2594473 RepID=A0A516ISG6_9SPHN|nr:DUF2141 domain-containing protein [Sphingomonas xanthus]QDP19845.1 DUF2141 domain-containing protein [Sphingomonas xanthus]